MVHYKKENEDGTNDYYYQGEGIFGSILKAVTSNAVKNVAKDLAVDLSKKATNKAIDAVAKKYIGKGRLTQKSKDILNKRKAPAQAPAVPIEKYVRKT